MSQPIVSVEAAGSRPVGSEIYRWELSGKPFVIEISLEVVERLDREVVQAFRAITSRGSEVGGILLGRVRPEDRTTVVIEDYEPVVCDYSRGPLYLLAEADRARWEQALARWKKQPPRDLSVVGFYRSNTRKELVLDAEDLALINQHFPDPHQLFLLVKPFASKANLGAFFLREETGLSRESSLTFPFNRAELVKSGAIAAAAAPPPAVASAPPASAATPPPASAAPPAGARVPIEIRIAVAGESPLPAVEAKAPAVKPPVEPKLSEANQQVSAAAPAEVKPAPARPIVEAEPAPEGKKVAGVGLEPISARAAVAESAATESRVESRAPGKRRSWMAMTALLVMAIAGLVLWLRSGAGPTGTTPGDSALGLRVERSGGQLLLSWNRALPLLQTAQRAILSISDGDHREDVEMDLGQLSGGSIVYSPITNDVSFRLEVTDLRNGKSFSESVRVLGGKPSPAGPLAEAGAAARPGAPGGTAPAASAPEESNPAQPPRAMLLPVSPARGESLAARLMPVEPIPGAEPPKVEPPLSFAKPPAAPPAPQEIAPESQATPAAVTTQPPAQGGQSAAQPAVQAAVQPSSQPATLAAKPAAETSPPATPSPAPAAKPSEQPSRVGGVVQEAKLIQRRDPVYPPLARQARLQGVVRLEAVIGPNGRVEKVEAISGPPLLRQAAMDAVRQWVYQPSTLNGQPVRVTTQIEVNFTLGR